jgi:hypothetical protein
LEQKYDVLLLTYNSEMMLGIDVQLSLILMGGSWASLSLHMSIHVLQKYLRTAQKWSSVDRGSFTPGSSPAPGTIY